MNRPIAKPLFKIRNLITTATTTARLWRINTKISNTIIITTFVGFGLSCLLLWLIADHQQQQQTKLIDAYGDALNQLTTNQLKVSMSNNNLIGLQSILNDLIDQTNAINAIVYGVNNKIIVQAGKINSIDSAKAYTSPITIDDALLGSLTINIDTRIDNSYRLFIILPALFAALLLLLLRTSHNHASDAVVNDVTSITGTHTASKENQNNASMSIQIEPKHQALLLLDFHTLDKLHQQLNAEARENEFEKLRSATQKILTLYSGKKIAASTNTILVGFENKDQKDCIFNALCCAYLLKQTCLKQQWLIRFSSYTYDQKDNITITDFSQLRPLNHRNSNQHNCEIFIKRRVISDHQLEGRFTLSPLPESEYGYITGLSKTYEKLIKSQLSYIL